MSKSFGIVNLSKGIVQAAEVAERPDGSYQVDLAVGKEHKTRGAWAGWVWAHAYWSSSGNSRTYNVRTVAQGNPMAPEGTRWSFVVPRGNAGGTFTSSNEGVLRAPGAKVDLPWKSDLWFVVLDSSPVGLAPAAPSLTLSHKRGEASVELAAVPGGLDWRLEVARLDRARGVRLELVRRSHPKTGWQETRELLASLNGPGTAEGRWGSLGPATPTLFISRSDIRPPDLRKQLSLPALANKCWSLGDPIPALASFQGLAKNVPFAWGEYRLEIVLDLRFRRDPREALLLRPVVEAGATPALPKPPASSNVFRPVP